MMKNSIEGTSGCVVVFFLSPFLLLFLPPQDYGNADAANQHYLREDMLRLRNQQREGGEVGGRKMLNDQ